jgi:hypothetical protein
MSWEREPEFLDREVVDAIHQHQVDTYGGVHGVRDENALESAIAAAPDVITTAAATFTRLPPPTHTISLRARRTSTATKGLGFKQLWSSWRAMALTPAACPSRKPMKR